MTYAELIRYAYKGAMDAWKHTKDARTYEPGSYDAHLFDRIDADVDTINALWDAVAGTALAGKEVRV